MSRFQIFRSGALLLVVPEVKHGLSERGASVKVVERTDHARNRKWKNVALEPERGEALGLHILRDSGREVGQQVAEFFPPLPLRRHSLIAREQESQIVAKPAVDCFLETQLQNVRSGLAFRLAPNVGTLRSGERDGW